MISSCGCFDVVLKLNNKQAPHWLINGWHIVLYLKMRCSLKKEKWERNWEWRERDVILDTHGRYVILVPSGRFVILDPTSWFVNRTLEADLWLWTLVANFLFWKLVAYLWFWTIVSDLWFLTLVADVVSGPRWPIPIVHTGGRFVILDPSDWFVS